SLEAALDGRPFEVGVPIVRQVACRERARMQVVEQPRHVKGKARAAVASDARHEEHPIGAEAKRREQAGGGKLGLNLVGAVFDLYDLAGRQNAVELGARAVRALRQKAASNERLGQRTTAIDAGAR